MTKEEIQVEYMHTTGENIVNSQGEPDIDYVEWLEIQLIEARLASDGDLANVSDCSESIDYSADHTNEDKWWHRGE